MDKASGGRAWKLLPCEPYVVDRFLPWLEEQAEKGLFLERLSSGGRGRFRRGEAKSLSYWIHTDPEGGPLEADKLAAYQERGWEPVAHDFTLRFHVFVAEKTALKPVELEDNGLQIYIAKQHQHMLIGAVGIAILYAVTIYLLHDDWAELWKYDGIGTYTVLLQAVAYLLLLAKGAEHAVCIRRMFQRSQAGNLFSPDTEPAHPYVFHRFLWWAFVIFIVTAVIILTGGILILYST